MLGNVEDVGTTLYFIQMFCVLNLVYPVNTNYLYNIYTMLDQRRGRWDDVVCYTNVLCFKLSPPSKHKIFV